MKWTLGGGWLGVKRRPKRILRRAKRELISDSFESPELGAERIIMDPYVIMVMMTLSQYQSKKMRR